MDEHISSLKDACQRYKDALRAVMAEFTAAVDHRNNDLAIQSAVQNLDEHYQGYILASKSLRDFVEMKLRELEETHHNIATAVSDGLAVLDLKRTEPEETVELKTAASQVGMHLNCKEELESEATYGDVHYASEDHNMGNKFTFLPVINMDEHTTSLKDALQRYKDALRAVIAEFLAAVGHRKNNLAINSAVQNLDEHYKGYILASRNLRDFIEMKLRELEVTHSNIATAVSEALAVLGLNRETLAAHTIAGGPNATETAPASPDSAQLSDPLVTDMHHGDEAEVSKGYKALVSLKGKEDLESEDEYWDASEEHDISDLNLSRLELKEAVEHHKVALPFLPDPDQNNNA